MGKMQAHANGGHDRSIVELHHIDVESARLE